MDTTRPKTGVSRHRAHQWVLGAKSPETEAICRHYLHVLTAETIENFAQFTS